MSEDRAIELKGPKKSRHSVKTKSRRMGKSKGPLRISGNSTELIRYVRQLNRRRSRSRGKAEEVEFESLSEDSATENEDPKQPGKSWRKSTRSWSRKTSLPAKGDIAGRSLPSSKLTREEESTTRNTKRSSFGEASISQAPQGAHAGAKSMLKTLGKFLVERKRGCLCCVCFWLVLVICAVGGWVILGMLQKESIVKFFPEDKNEVDDKALLFPSAAEPSIMPSQYPSAEPSDTQPQLTIVVMVQLDEDPDSVGFYLQSADNTMTYISRDVGSFAHLYHGQLVEEPALITLGTRVMFTFSGNGQYQIISYGEEMVTLISDSRESSYSFTAGLDDAKQINVVDPNEFDPDFGPSDFDPIEFDPNEYCLPCPTGNCGRCAWCEADKGFQPDVVYGYRCHSSPRSIPEEVNTSRLRGCVISIS
ncbi:hypothetical protein THAOC_37745 [Thalassiosira oceanica]|uniref:Uncharacterized protein n=1 Tax=Thalassiosira oceanica TaxID=159749 RepID=K0QY69_THAOC|nr:hypothetical protein THAOC_37745 [Thalassiosira oceanica]|eukprot:EJK43778.1 hypothetical protein THAOC_37745 [Thalassiosira oceanica]